MFIIFTFLLDVFHPLENQIFMCEYTLINRVVFSDFMMGVLRLTSKILFIKFFKGI